MTDDNIRAAFRDLWTWATTQVGYDAATDRKWTAFHREFLDRLHLEHAPGTIMEIEDPPNHPRFVGVADGKGGVVTRSPVDEDGCYVPLAVYREPDNPCNPGVVLVPLCVRCGLPENVHGHGECGTREMAIPIHLRASHPFEPPPESSP